jgi:hypothetical protein
MATLAENIKAAARRRYKDNCPPRLKVWTALLNTSKDLWRGYLIDVDTKIIVSCGPIREGRDVALDALKEKLKTRKRSA